MVQSASDENQAGPSKPHNQGQIKLLKSDLQQSLNDMVLHEHHRKFMATAITKDQPPPGLTPKVNVTAKGITNELSSKVERLLKDTGLQIVHLLYEHHEEQSLASRKKAEEIRNKMEACAKKCPNSGSRNSNKFRH